MKLLLPLLILPLLSHAATDVGFKNGSVMKAVPVSGKVTVYCPPSPISAKEISTTYNCQNILLEPSAYDYFVGPAGLVADNFTLQVTREDGSTRAKTDKYDGIQTRSTSMMNLWISTLFQRPLLKKGRNKISYTLVQDKAAVGQGQFEVLVQEEPARECPVSQYVSTDPVDCNSAYSVCERYFLQYNNCTLN